MITTIEQLARYAIDSANNRTGEDHQITCWEERDGVVYVAGEPAPGGYQVNRIPVRKSYERACQRCKDSNITVPMVLWVRFEHALGRLMYWFGTDLNAKVPWQCEGCLAQARERRAGAR